MVFPTNHGHTYEILYEDGDNKVVYCNECRAFHIHYGNFSVDASNSAVESLIHTLGLYFEHYKETVHPQCRCIEIDTPYEGFRMLLSTADIRLFGQMLESAYRTFHNRVWESRNN